MELQSADGGTPQPEILPHHREKQLKSSPEAGGFKDNARDRNWKRSQPFRCTLCPNAYATKKNLEKHLAIKHKQQQQPSFLPNESKESLQCNMCPRKFLRSETLKKHITNEHVDDSKKPFQCQVCLTTKNKCKKFMTEKSLNYHMKKIHGPPRYECELCSQKFNDSSNLARHRILHSDAKSFKCGICSSFFTNKRTLNVHLLRKHNHEGSDMNIFNCELCEHKFLSKSALEYHVVRVHVVDKQFECQVCSKTYIDERQLSNHSKIHTKFRFVCDVCSEKFTYKISLMSHLQKKHDRSSFCMKCRRSFENTSEFLDHSKLLLDTDSKLECQICLETFKTECFLSAHTESHLDELNANVNEEIVTTKHSSVIQLFQCDLCSKSFGSTFYLSAHRKRHHPDAKWQCKTCLKTFHYRHMLNKHEETHRTDRTYSCKVCQKSFKTSISLKSHEQIHLEEKRYKCHLCPKSFVISEGLKMHNANYHGGEKPFRCHLCPQSWVNSSLLKRHLFSHTNELAKCDLCPKFFKSAKHVYIHKRQVHEKHLSKTRIRNQITKRPYPCKICEKSFTTSLRLKYHEKTHLAETLYKCQNCTKSFSRSWKLKVHLANFHSGENPFKCYLCSKSFIFRSQLKFHLTVHITEKTVKCDLCPKYFKRVWHMQNHKRKVHQKLKYRNRFLCKLCSFESKDHKDIATHYSEHSLPVVVLSEIVFSTSYGNAFIVSSMKKQM